MELHGLPISWFDQLCAPTTIGTLAFLAFLTFALGWHKKLFRSKNSPPEPAGSWPVVGHLGVLAKAEVPHLTLGQLADKYGPVYKIRLGVHDVVVVNSSEAAKECLAANEKLFLSRPKTHAFELLGYSYAMFGLSPYGAYWREIRKISALELLSNQRLEILKPVRMSEIRTNIKAIYDKWDSKREMGGGTDYQMMMDLKKWLTDLFLNSILRLIAGQSLSDLADESTDDGYQLVLRNFLKLAGTFMASDALPFLKFLDIGGYAKAMKKVSKEVDHYTTLWLENHKRDRAAGKVKTHQDFMDIMLDLLENTDVEPFGYDKDTIIKATCLTLILAGGETSAITLTWGISMLLNHPEVLKKAQEELDKHVGRDRQLTESDMSNLVYIQAILKETLRLYPAVPLSVPREAMSDATINGYNIKAGSRLFVNVYKIQRDPRVWEDPCAFKPERFLAAAHKDVDIRGQHFELIPFGSGRRICPGISYSMQAMSFVLATMLHCFNLSPPSSELIDMTEDKGLNNVKATPLDVLLTPRLPPHLYQVD